MTPRDRFTADAKHLERVAAWLYDRAGSPIVRIADEESVALTAFSTAATLDLIARDLREYATLYAGRIP